jgi:hypothetical protein
LLLHVVLGGLRGVGLAAPWAERLVWVALAVLLWVVAPALPSSSRLPRLPVSEATRFVGVAMSVAPLLWRLAVLLVLSLRISLQGNWRSDGPVLLEAQFLSDLVRWITPWLLAGVTLLVLARHLPPD